MNREHVEKHAGNRRETDHQAAQSSAEKPGSDLQQAYGQSGCQANAENRYATIQQRKAHGSILKEHGVKPIEDMQGPSAGGDCGSQFKEVMQVIVGRQLVEKHDAVGQKAEDSCAEESPGHGGSKGRKKFLEQGILSPHIPSVRADPFIHFDLPETNALLSSSANAELENLFPSMHSDIIY